MNPGIIATIAYGALSLLGGLFGYVKAKSTVSLMSGGISGIILILLGVLALQGKAWGLALAIPLTIGLVCVFIVRIMKTGKWMPGIVMIVAGLLAFFVMLYQLLEGQTPTDPTLGSIWIP
ncbi:MAG: TMEM14 family protein [Microcoleaceae cyanobacterium]